MNGKNVNKSKALRKNAAERNNFQEKYPLLAREWHPTKNGEFKPSDFSCSSEYEAWWLCPICNYEYPKKITKRTNRGFGCPICAKQSTSFAEQTILYYLRKIFSDVVNRDVSFGFELDIYIPSINAAIEYDGIRWHKSESKFEKDIQKDIKCYERNISLFRFRDPSLKKTKYATIIECKDGNNNELESAIFDLFKKLNIVNIPDIDIRKDSSLIMSMYARDFRDNSLERKFPELAKEWHPRKNGNLKPSNVPWSHSKNVWWLCSKCGYEWSATPNKRTNKSNPRGCKLCSIKKVNKLNSIEIINLDTNEVFASLTDAAKSCNGRKSDICTCCNGGQKTAFGYRWAYVDENNRRTKTVRTKIRNIETGQVFANSQEAAEWCNGDNRNINKCCNKKCNTAYGYHWEYVND